MRAIEWANATVRRGVLPVVSADHADRMTGPLRFDGGVYQWYLDPAEVEVGERYRLVPEDGAEDGPIAVRYGDLDGDGCDEAVLRVVADGWGANRGREALWIVRLADGAAEIVATVAGGNGYCGQLVAAPEIRGRALWTKRATQAGDDEGVFRPDTCGCGNLGGGVRTQRWIWREGRLVEDRGAGGFVLGPECG